MSNHAAMIINRFRISIRSKLVLSFLLLVVTLVTAFVSFSYYRTRNVMALEIRKRGVDVTRTFTQMVKTYIMEMDYVTILDNARELVENSDILCVSVFDRDGGVIVSTENRDAAFIEAGSFYSEALSGNVVRQRIVARHQEEILESVSPVKTLSRVEYLLSIEMPLAGIEKELAESRRQIWIIACLVSLLALLMAALLSRKITGPLRKLVDGAEEISKGNLNQAIHIQTGDETGELADTFNRMTNNLRRELKERKRSEIDLRNSQEMFRTVMNSIDAHVYASDLKTNEILYMNKNLQDLFEGDRTGEKCWKVFRREAGPCGVCKNSKLMDDHNRPSGVQVWEGQNPITGLWYMNYDRAVKWTDGRYVHIQVAADITDRKKMEEERMAMETQLRQSQKMESIGTLAGGIAHDFNNILSPIIGFTEMAIDDADDQPKIRDSLEEILIAGKRAKELVQQILTFSRQDVKELKPMRVQSAIREALKLLRSSLPTTIQFREEIDLECGPIMGDPTQIHQVIMNLGANAYHAMEASGGILTVDVRETDIVTQKDVRRFNVSKGRYLQLVVSDTGIGMSQDIVDKIFDPYFTTKKEGRGTGMGLSVVHGIAKGSNGSISVSSEIGKGTTFTIIFPLVAKRHLFLIKETSEKDIAKERGSILVVDDEEQIVRMVKRMLERMGYHVCGRTSSVDAFELFRKQPDRFDLVVTDLTMPNMTGDQLAEKMMRVRPELPIILTSGFSEKLSGIEAGQTKIAKILMKPIIKENLREVVRELLDQKGLPFESGTEQ